MSETLEQKLLRGLDSFRFITGYDVGSIRMRDNEIGEYIKQARPLVVDHPDDLIFWTAGRKIPIQRKDAE